MDFPTSAIHPRSSVSTSSSFPLSSSSIPSLEKSHHQRTNTSGLPFPPGERLVPRSLTPSTPPPPTGQCPEPTVPRHDFAHSVRVAFGMTPLVSPQARSIGSLSGSPGYAPRGSLPVSHSGVRCSLQTFPPLAVPRSSHPPSLPSSGLSAPSTPIPPIPLVYLLQFSFLPRICRKTRWIPQRLPCSHDPA